MVSLSILRTLLKKVLIIKHSSKNAQIINHHRNKYFFIYFSPFFIMLLINVLQAWTDANFTWENSNPPEYQLDKIPKCYGDGCLTLGYIVSGTFSFIKLGTREPYIDSILSHVRDKNDLNQDDIQPLNFTK